MISAGRPSNAEIFVLGVPIIGACWALSLVSEDVEGDSEVKVKNREISSMFCCVYVFFDIA